MITVGLFKRDDSKADALVNEIAKAFADAGISTTAAPGLHITASACKQCNGTRRVLACCEYHAHWQDRLARCERCSADVPFPTLIVSVGGDGTFLRALSSLGKFLPVVGLNGGTLGFLTRYTQAESQLRRPRDHHSFAGHQAHGAASRWCLRGPAFKARVQWRRGMICKLQEQPRTLLSSTIGLALLAGCTWTGFTNTPHVAILLVALGLTVWFGLFVAMTIEAYSAARRRPL